VCCGSVHFHPLGDPTKDRNGVLKSSVDLSIRLFSPRLDVSVQDSSCTILCTFSVQALRVPCKSELIYSWQKGLGERS